MNLDLLPLLTAFLSLSVLMMIFTVRTCMRFTGCHSVSCVSTLILSVIITVLLTAMLEDSRSSIGSETRC